MDAAVRNVQSLFSGQHRYVVPPYQRPYVWTEEDQWGPLWDDVDRITTGRLDGGEPKHFLGAVVIRREKTPVGGVTEWSVIDGQQRLTTLQLLLSALAEKSRLAGLQPEWRKLDALIQHPEHDAVDDERFKFWPTSTNQAAYRAVLEHRSDSGQLIDDPTNTVHEAWEFFAGRIEDFVSRDGADEEEASRRYAALREAVVGLLQIVTISLDPADPAQVIFETLNARGTPLLELDLVKNAVFDLAQQAGADLDELHEKEWRPHLGDSDYWSTDQRLGRTLVPRSEAFLYHWLVMHTGSLVAANSLFDTFRTTVLAGPLAADPVALVKRLNHEADVLRRLDDLPKADHAGRRFMRALNGLDTTTMVPLALLLYSEDIDQARRDRALQAVESYLVRRLLMGLSSKNYSQLAARLVQVARTDLTVADERIIDELLDSAADTYRWPMDDEVAEHLRTRSLYGWLGQKRIAYVLAEIERKLRSTKSEEVDLPEHLQVEHLLPQAWEAHWPLADDDPETAERRNGAINRLGNLTLVTGSLNASVSNSAWDTKRPELSKHSVLRLNNDLSAFDRWDEGTIEERGAMLTEGILSIWSGPQAFVPEGWIPNESERNAELAAMSSAELAAMCAQATPLQRALLAELAETPDVRRSYAEIETSLGWTRGRVASVMGGYGTGFGKTIGGRRPWRIDLAPDGTWSAWVERERADIVRELLAAAQ